MLVQLLGAREAANLARNPWSRELDAALAREMGLSWRTLVGYGLTFETLRMIERPLEQFEAIYGTLENEFDRGIGKLTASNLKSLGWDENAYTLRVSSAKRELTPGVPPRSKPRRILNV